MGIVSRAEREKRTQPFKVKARKGDILILPQRLVEPDAHDDVPLSFR